MEPERFPIGVRLLGVLHKEKSKMYMTSVLWSDQNDIVVYRSFDEFKKMHNQLKKAFPSTSKVKKSDRILPKFRGNKMKQKGRGKGPTKSLVHLKGLQKYCSELLSCDPRVPQSSDLIMFFQPKNQDLDPQFVKNSITIMLSEDEITSNGGRVEAGNVTQPFVTETYRCVAPYETKDTKNKPFKVAVDEIVDVLIKDKAGWWLVENESKQMAWFPAPYLEKVDEDEDEDEDELDWTAGRGMLYTAVKSYKSTKDDEITVNMGTVVEVMQNSDNGWWLIRYKGKTGYVPAMCLQPYNHPHVHMSFQSQHLQNFSPFLSPASLQQQSQHSRSQGNLLQLPPVRSSSPNPTQAERTQRSHSLTDLFEAPQVQPSRRSLASATNDATPTAPAKQAPLPAIMVKMNEDREQSGSTLTTVTEESFGSDSFSDEFSSSSDESSLNLSSSANDEQLSRSRTPPPTAANYLSPTSITEGKLLPSVSDPNLYKGPTAPMVPPRPRTQDILTRCSTVTRKNAAKVPPTQTEISSQ
ncbi:NADPH oxidase organizer 1a [Odontesthes bonariensis]|uniref:NADPH oxidase organizer 1a isoform X2 n=1 Tax=Odontesthes bonariensis TaxID=219752 RepID=UPI003F58BD70